MPAHRFHTTLAKHQGRRDAADEIDDEYFVRTLDGACSQCPVRRQSDFVDSDREGQDLSERSGTSDPTKQRRGRRRIGRNVSCGPRG